MDVAALDLCERNGAGQQGRDYGLTCSFDIPAVTDRSRAYDTCLGGEWTFETGMAGQAGKRIAGPMERLRSAVSSAHLHGSVPNEVIHNLPFLWP
jgi:hypothetical protein